MKAITPTHYAVECDLNWLPVPNQNTRRSPARGNERASGDETNLLHVCVNLLRLRRKLDSVAVEEGNCRIAGAKDYNALEISDEA